MMKDKLNKLANISIKYKLLIIVLVSIIIAIFNFIYYNYQTLKLPESERVYSLDLKSIETSGTKYKNGKLYTSNDSTINLNISDKFVKKIVINYESTDRYKIKYEGQTGNKYGLYYDFIGEDTCFSELGICGMKFNNKINDMKLKINQDNVIISEIKVVNSIDFNLASFIFWFIGINLILCIFFFKDHFSNNKHILIFITCMSVGTIFLFATHNMTSIALDDDSHYKYYSTFIVDDTKISKSDYFLGYYIITFHNIDTPEEKDAYQEFIDENDDNYIDTINYKTNLLKSSKLNYIPIASLMKIASVLSIPKNTTLILCRVFQLLLYSFVIAYAVKLIPTHKNLLMVIALFPQTLFLTTSFNYDPTVTAFTLLAFSAFVNEYNAKTERIKP